jgi:hypothetical protein
MSIFTGMGKPVRLQDLTGRRPLIEQMKRCSCGAVTFLPLPCRRCGKTELTPVRTWAEDMGRNMQRKNLLLSVAAAVAAGGLIAALSGGTALALLGAVPLIPLAIAIPRGWLDKQTLTRYWLFHREAAPSGLSMKKIPLLEEAALEEYINGYEGDLNRLERMLENAKDQQQAEAVYLNCRQLAQVFHNRRVSELMFNCLRRMTLYEGVCVDLDEICRHLMAEDADEESTLLEVLSECARFTCVPPGEDTARAMLRIFGMRLQRAYAASAPSNSTLAALTYRKKVQFYFSEEEREHIRRIWFSTGGTGCTDTALAAAALQRITTEFEESGAATTNIYDLAEGDRTFARYWSELCWYGADSEPRRALEQLIELENDPMMYALSKNWNTAGAQEEA